MNPIVPKSIADVEALAKFFFKSSIVRTQHKSIDDVGYIIAYALEKDIPITEAIQQYSFMARGNTVKLIAKGEVLLSQVKKSGFLEYYHEEIEGNFDDETAVGVVTLQRVGEEKKPFRFSINDAKKAKLWKRPGPWTDYPQRMLIMRARGFALRDVFPDVLSGAYTLEEARDIPDNNAIEVYEAKPTKKLSAPQAKIEHKEKTKPKQTKIYTSKLFNEEFVKTSTGEFHLKSGVIFSKEEVDDMKTMSDDEKKELYNLKLETLNKDNTNADTDMA